MVKSHDESRLNWDSRFSCLGAGERSYDDGFADTEGVTALVLERPHNFLNLNHGFLVA